MNGLDLLLTALFGLGAVSGWIRGLVLMAAGLLGYVAAFLTAGAYTPAAVDWLIGQGAKTWLVKQLTERLGLPDQAQRVPASGAESGQLPDWLRQMQLPEEYRQHLAERFTPWAGAVGSGRTVADFVYDQLAIGILSLLTYLVLAALTLAVVNLVARALHLTVRGVPLVSSFNRVGGAAVGVLEWALGAGAVLALLSPALGLSAFTSLGKAVAGSTLAPRLTALYLWAYGLVFGKSGFLLW